MPAPTPTLRLSSPPQVSVIPGNTLSKEEFEARQKEFKDHKVVCYW